MRDASFDLRGGAWKLGSGKVVCLVVCLFVCFRRQSFVFTRQMGEDSENSEY